MLILHARMVKKLIRGKREYKTPAINRLRWDVERLRALFFVEGQSGVRSRRWAERQKRGRSARQPVYVGHSHAIGADQQLGIISM